MLGTFELRHNQDVTQDGTGYSGEQSRELFELLKPIVEGLVLNYVRDVLHELSPEDIAKVKQNIKKDFYATVTAIEEGNDGFY